jgi:DNA polymerase I-like protein with 3'-5' exonuclease and polymerase domains
MIYLVSDNKPESPYYSTISVEKSLELLHRMSIIQCDTETDGRDAHINHLLCIQFGNDALDVRIVVDLQYADLNLYKGILEEKMLIFQNGKFDLQFLYNYGIHPLKVYDTMIVEQFLHLGYPSGSVSYSLKEIAKRRLDVDLDKTIRSQIIWRGLDEDVILYSANDVVYLEKIMKSQMEDVRKIENAVNGVRLECDFVPVIAYLEWCGIKLDEGRWKEKMKSDQENLDNSIKALNDFVVRTSSLKKYVFVDYQGDLFTGFNLEPQVKINWSSSQQVVQVAKILGFDTTVQDKKSGEDKDSVLEKFLMMQKGVNDEFLKLYFSYQEYAKVVSSFGQIHLNSINPVTGRLHTSFKQLGAASGRMSCGSNQPNTDLSTYKHLPNGSCKYVNLQQLPHDETTRAAFVAEEGFSLIDCDWSAAEARLAGDIYNDQAIKDIFLNDIDSHSMYAKIFFKKELEGIDVKDIKKLRPDLRQKAKGPEFALNFGGGISAIMSSIGCTEEEANEIIRNYEEGFKGTAEFAKKGSKFVRENGYVVMNPMTGHRMIWWDWNEWKERGKTFTPEFWEDYRNYHKGTGDAIALMVKTHFKAASKWDRMARNAPTQG